VDLLRPIAIGIAIALAVAGCGRRAAPPESDAKKPAGRLVPAGLAGFERGPGGWKSAPVGVADASMEAPVVVQGDAGKGEHWLSQTLTVPPGETRGVNIYGVVPSQDWSRFGQTVRAVVRAAPEGAGITARLYLVSPDGAESLGPEQPISGGWTPLAWDAGEAVSRVGRIGVRWTVPGPWHGRLGLDNVRIGAEDALTTAYSVVNGPYPSREAASGGMKMLKDSNVPSFPIYEQGWYLNLGTFSTRKAAEQEAKRLAGNGLETSVLVR